MTVGLDRIDLKILHALQQDASRSAAEIAEAVGLSQSPCWRRIQRLKEDGYITRIVAILDRRKLDLRAQLFVQAKLVGNDTATLAEFSQAIRDFPEVMECHAIGGSYDFLLRIVVQDMDAYEKFYFDKLSRVPSIREMNSAVVVSEIRETTALPLPRRNSTTEEEAAVVEEDSTPRLRVNRVMQPSADLHTTRRALATPRRREFA